MGDPPLFKFLILPVHGFSIVWNRPLLALLRRTVGLGCKLYDGLQWSMVGSVDICTFLSLVREISILLESPQFLRATLPSLTLVVFRADLCVSGLCSVLCFQTHMGWA